MAALNNPFAIPLLLLLQMPLLLVPLVVLGLRLEDEQARMSAQLDAQAQSVSLALTSYLHGIEGHMRVLSLRVPEHAAEVSGLARDAQAVLMVTRVDGIRLESPAGDTLLHVDAAPREATLASLEERPFVVAVPVERAHGRHVLAAQVLPRSLLAAVEGVGLPAGWTLRIVAPDGRSVTQGRRDAESNARLVSVRHSPPGWQTQVRVAGSAVYASLWQSAGRELLLILLAVVLGPPLAWQLVRSMRQVTVSPDSELQHAMLHEVEARQHAIARELHDSVGSSLSGIGLLLSTARHTTERPRFLKILDMAQQQVADSAQQVRQISRGMMPVGTGAGGLLSALVQLAGEIGTIEGVSCTVLVRGRFDDVPATHGTHLFRIVQEATGNALRHGRASRIRILLARVDSRCRLSIVDDGRGCSPEAIFSTSGGVGMRSIRSRAGAIGASVDFLAQPGRGLRVRITWLSAPSSWDQ